ncbi:MAG: Pr6Pr family membrane protein [Bacteroidales bacterium]|nr:Pr6Pr family membrane protein [Bacteroidales bacterium]
MRKNDLKKLILALVLITTAQGIGIDVYVNSLDGGILKGLSIFKYFTLQSNALVLVYSLLALANFRAMSEKVWFKKALTPVTSYIMLTGITFLIILAPTSTAQGLQKVASDLLHYLVPSLMFFYWIVFEERELRYSYVWSWIIYPFIFMFWGLYLAIIKGDYLYPFFDISKLGIMIVPYLAGMTVAVILIGSFLVFLRKRLSVPRIS